MFLRPLAMACMLALAACAGPRPPAPVPPVAEDAEAWHDVALPGKPLTIYSAASKDGRQAIAAVSERSASLWRCKKQLASAQIGEVSFSWWVSSPVEGGHVGDMHKDDASARVLFAFNGDIASLPMRTRMLFELAEALTGEQPPYATLMYVWDSHAPVGSVIISQRSDRVRKIVVDSGSDSLGQWRDHRRDLAADFRLAFGEAPGALQSMAIMTDSDNTRSSAQAWYGPVSFHPPPALPERP
jgi:hypothetical protein